MDFQLMEYQQDLLDKIINSLDKTGRAGLELFTSGGKSLIGMKLIEHYVNKTDKKVMWIAPRAALDNVSMKYISKSPYKDHVWCVSLNVLSNLNKLLDKKSEYREYCLIIIDEAHKLMAKNAYEQFQIELEKFNKRVKIFAMTASSYRNLDGIRSLEEITKNGNIFKYNLADAINDNVANPVLYYGTTLEYNKNCYQALSVLRDKYGKIPYVDYILSHVENKLRQSESSTERKVADFMKSKVKFNAKDGDRHIVFFSRIAELKEQKEMVYKIMKRWYPGRYTTINIIEYHGDLSSKECNAAIKTINSDAKRNTVDVILTVDKGSESIHPEHIRSIILFRGTQSMVKFTQMIGRVITLTMANNQANYVFDFCKSISLIGANSILIGNRKLEDRTERSSDLTPEQLLSDALGIKNQVSGVNSFIEVNLDQTIEELNELFDRLGTMYNMLEACKVVLEYLKDKLPIIDEKYNGNVAKFLSAVRPDLSKVYRKLQSAVMYQALSMGDSEAIKQSLVEVLGDRLYLTVKMTHEQEENIRHIKALDENPTDLDMSTKLIVDTATKEEYLQSIALQVLTDKAPTSMVKFIEQRTGLYQQLVRMLPDLDQNSLGCKNEYKISLGKQLIDIVKSSENLVITEENWTYWRAVYSYIRYCNVSEDKPETLGDISYALALQKYVRVIHPKSREYKLSDRDINLGSKVMRVLENVENNTVENMLPLDENFAIELIMNKYRDNQYIRDLIACSPIRSLDFLRQIIEQKSRIYKLINKMKKEPTEENLITLINYIVQSGVDVEVQKKILSMQIVKDIMNNVGKDGDTTLTRYCIAKLTNDDYQMQEIVKKAAKNGLGYDTIVALAFPTEAFTEAKDIINKMKDTQEDSEGDAQELDQLKSRYCRMPYATPRILQTIRLNILPKKICQAERKFINYMEQV